MNNNRDGNNRDVNNRDINNRDGNNRDGTNRDGNNSASNDRFNKITDMILKEKDCINDASIQQLVATLRDKAEKQKPSKLLTRKKPFSAIQKATITNAERNKLNSEQKEKLKLETLIEKLSNYMIQQKGKLVEQDILDVENYLKRFSSTIINKDLPNLNDAAKARKMALPKNIKLNSINSTCSSKDINSNVKNRLNQNTSYTYLKNSNNEKRLPNTKTKFIGSVFSPSSRPNSCNHPKIAGRKQENFEKRKMNSLYGLKQPITPIKRQAHPNSNQIKSLTITEGYDALKKDSLANKNVNKLLQGSVQPGSRNNTINNRSKWKNNEERIAVLMTDDFLKSLISIERNKENHDPNNLLHLYDKITEIFAVNVPNLNINNVEQMAAVLRNYSKRIKPKCTNVFSSVTPDIPKWALKGFLQIDTSHNPITIVKPLLENMAEFIINNKGALLKCDITNFCDKMMKKLSDQKRKEDNHRNGKLELGIHALQANLKNNKAGTLAIMEIDPIQSQKKTMGQELMPNQSLRQHLLQKDQGRLLNHDVNIGKDSIINQLPKPNIIKNNLGRSLNQSSTMVKEIPSKELKKHNLSKNDQAQFARHDSEMRKEINSNRLPSKQVTSTGQEITSKPNKEEEHPIVQKKCGKHNLLLKSNVNKDNHKFTVHSALTDSIKSSLVYIQKLSEQILKDDLSSKKGSTVNKNISTTSNTVAKISEQKQKSYNLSKPTSRDDKIPRPTFNKNKYQINLCSHNFRMNNNKIQLEKKEEIITEGKHNLTINKKIIRMTKNHHMLTEPIGPQKAEIDQISNPPVMNNKKHNETTVEKHFLYANKAEMARRIRTPSKSIRSCSPSYTIRSCSPHLTTPSYTIIQTSTLTTGPAQVIEGEIQGKKHISTKFGQLERIKLKRNTNFDKKTNNEIRTITQISLKPCKTYSVFKPVIKHQTETETESQITKDTQNNEKYIQMVLLNNGSKGIANETNTNSSQIETKVKEKRKHLRHNSPQSGRSETIFKIPVNEHNKFLSRQHHNNLKIETNEQGKKITVTRSRSSSPNSKTASKIPVRQQR